MLIRGTHQFEDLRYRPIADFYVTLVFSLILFLSNGISMGGRLTRNFGFPKFNLVLCDTFSFGVN